MEPWDKASVIEWIKAHRGEEIVIRMQGGAVRLQGRARRVEQLDACSTEIAEAEIAFGHRDMETSLSFHDDTLAVHLIAFHPGTRDVAASIPVSIPYGSLLLDTAEELETKTRVGAGKKKEAEEEPEFSPYELLH